MLADVYGIGVTDDNSTVFNACDVVFLAVKPQQMPDVLAGIAGGRPASARARKLVISIAAGIPIRKLEQGLYAELDEKQRQALPIVRVMPNTPALVLCGMSGMSANRYATAQDIHTAVRLLASFGKVLEFAESELDAVTGLSGSGPAYVFCLAEAMVEAGRAVGLDPEKAAVLVLTTLKGAVKLLETSGEPPEELRRKVTSPGGTTEAAMRVFEQNEFKATVVQAIAAATRRAGELSR
jgi:pyrroline-5-carboxylate reductase